MREPPLHSTSEVSFPIAQADLANTISPDASDRFPAVFATSRLVAFMEIAASRVLKPILEPGELSVGVSIETTHTAATPLGLTIRAVAKYLGVEGRLYVFEVVAFDDTGEIGRGTHKRAIALEERLLAGAERRRTI